MIARVLPAFSTAWLSRSMHISLRSPAQAGPRAARPHPGPDADRALGRPSSPLSAVLGAFMITLDATVVNVALPSIRHAIGGGMTGLEWVVDGYTLLFGALLLSAGALSDRLGARRVFGAGLVLFMLASAVCALAPTLGCLVVARMVQGAAAATVMPSSMALVREAHADPARRARAVAGWAMGSGVAGAAGPFLGGLLSVVSWRLIFLVNLPVGVVALVWLSRTRSSPRRPASLDLPGQVAVAVAMAALAYGVIAVGDAGWTAPRVWIAMMLAVVAFAGFLLAEARAPHPMVAPELFSSSSVAITATVGLAFTVAFSGVPFLFSLYLQQVRSLSSLATGMVFLPMMAVSASLTPASARIVERVGPRAAIVGGQLLMACGLAVLCLVPASTSSWALALLMLPLGAAAPLIVPPVVAVLLNSVPAHLAGTASGVFNVGRRVGGILSIAVFGALVARSATFMHGVRVSLLIATLVLLATASASLRLGSRAQA